MKPLFAAVIILISFGSLRSQVSDSLVASPLIIPTQYAHLYDSAQLVYLPRGFECSLFYTQSASWTPRMLAIDPLGRVSVADLENSNVFALPDNNHDGAADTAILLAYNDSGAHSIAFYNGALYTAASTVVMKYEHPNANGLYADSSVFIANIPNVPEGVDNHFTRTILFDTVGKNIFLSVGSPCNACREKDTLRGSILRFNLDGSGRRIYATGLRNAVGITMDQAANLLWASVADRNNLGDNIPPELATHIEDGGFYGWPISYGNHEWVDFQADSEYKAMLPATHADTVLVNSMKVPDIFFDAHSTPLSLAFYYGDKLPAEYNGNIFITLHGSYPSIDGRLVADGTKIMRAQKVTGKWIASDFVTGFLTDSIKYLRWARPCGMVIDTSGDIYFSSDQTTTHAPAAIFKISFVGNNGVKSSVLQSMIQVFPNPTNDIVTIDNVPSYIRNITVVNILGQTMMQMQNIQSSSVSLNFSVLKSGTYYIRLSSHASVVTKMIVKE